MDVEKVHLPEEHETYLSTLYGKALDSRAENPIPGDTFAGEVDAVLELRVLIAMNKVDGRWAGQF